MCSWQQIKELKKIKTVEENTCGNMISLSKYLNGYCVEEVFDLKYVALQDQQVEFMGGHNSIDSMGQWLKTNNSGVIKLGCNLNSATNEFSNLKMVA